MTATAIQPSTQQIKPRYEWISFYTTKEVKGDTKTTINPLMFLECLNHLGFYRMDLDTSPYLVKITDNVIEIVDDIRILDTFIEYIRSFGEFFPDAVSTRLIEMKFLHQMKKYTEKKFLFRLATTDVKIQQHTKESAFFYYQNGFIEVTPKDIKFKPYSQLSGKVWKSNILNRNFKKSPDFEKSNYAKFIRNISNNWNTRFYDKEKNPFASPKRYQKYKQMLGHTMHDFHEGKSKACILTDSRMSEIADGRSGKTLVMKCVSRMLNSTATSKAYVEINGKSLNLDYNHKWQDLTPETQLVHVNDVAAGFDIEKMFDDISEGFYVQPKGKKPYRVFAKVVLTSNRSVRIEGGSAEDRVLQVETADYYRAKYGPNVEFGQWFFTDWDDKDWRDFDNFMIHCSQEYLKHGLNELDEINLSLRKMIYETSPEFCSFMEMENDGVKKYKTIDNYDSRTLLYDFTEFHSDIKKFKSPQRTINKWVSIYAKHHPDIKECIDRKSNNKQLFTYVLEDGVEGKKEDKEDNPDWYKEDK